MIPQANIPVYIKLTSTDHLSIDAAKEWYRVVKSVLGGLMTEIETMDINYHQKQVKLVRRAVNDGTELIIPLIRDVLPSEMKRVADRWQMVSPSGNYSISSNPTQNQKLNQAVAGLSISNDEYQRLCVELAKTRHEGWIREKSATGWSYGSVLSLENKTHPLMRPWADLPEKYRNVDSKNPEEFLNIINNQGFAVVRQEELGSLLKLLRDIK